MGGIYDYYAYSLIWANCNGYGSSTVYRPYKAPYLGISPKYGNCSHNKHCLAMTPRSYRGLGLTNLYIQQLIDHLKVACNHGGTSTEIGILLSIGLESFALQAGVGGSPLLIDPSVIT